MATRRWLLVTATTSAVTLFSGVSWAAAWETEDRLLAWTELLKHSQAAGRIGKALAEEMPVARISELLSRQQARFRLAAEPSLALLHDMMAEDYLQERTVAARRVVFSEAEAALFLTCHGADAGTRWNDV